MYIYLEHPTFMNSTGLVPAVARTVFYEALRSKSFRVITIYLRINYIVFILSTRDRHSGSRWLLYYYQHNVIIVLLWTVDIITPLSFDVEIPTTRAEIFAAKVGNFPTSFLLRTRPRAVRKTGLRRIVSSTNPIRYPAPCIDRHYIFHLIRLFWYRTYKFGDRRAFNDSRRSI